LPFKRIRKRDGRLAPLAPSKITEAVFGALREVGRPDRILAEAVAGRALDGLAARTDRRAPHVEEIQDAVEQALMGLGLADAARAYVAYRREHAEALPLYSDSALARRGFPPFRNAQVMSIAPTGTISIIAGTTSGIEPLFAVGYVRNVLGTTLVETNPLFERVARDRGFYSDELMFEIARTGGVRKIRAVPDDVRRAFVTALEVEPEWHLRMQAVFQRETDAAVSKTVNLPASATVDDVERIYLDAWRRGLKGITIYRYGSKPQQVLRFLSESSDGPAPPVQVDMEYAGGGACTVCTL
jgi:ribonucleoside-diphosphate reductase alpha chain